MQTDGPCEIIFGFPVSYCGTARTAVSNSTALSGAISESGAFIPIQVAPAVESIAKMH